MTANTAIEEVLSNFSGAFGCLSSVVFIYFDCLDFQKLKSSKDTDFLGFQKSILLKP